MYIDAMIKNLFYKLIARMDSWLTRRGLILAEPITRISGYRRQTPRSLNIDPSKYPSIIGLAELQVTDNYYFGHMCDYHPRLHQLVLDDYARHFPDEQQLAIGDGVKCRVETQWDENADSALLGEDLRILVMGEDLTEFMRKNMRGPVSILIIRTEAPFFNYPVEVVLLRFYRADDAMLVKLWLPMAV